jgi:hypothetical protein
MTIELDARELLAKCPQCETERPLPENWQDILRKSMPPAEAAAWDGVLRCRNGHSEQVEMLIVIREKAVVLRRDLAGRFRYMAAKLREGDEYREGVALALEVLADEAEGFWS